MTNPLVPIDKLHCGLRKRIDQTLDGLENVDKHVELNQLMAVRQTGEGGLGDIGFMRKEGEVVCSSEEYIGSPGV